MLSGRNNRWALNGQGQQRPSAGSIALAPAQPRSRTHIIRYRAQLERLRAALVYSFMLEVDRRRLFLWLPVFYAIGIIGYFAAEREPSWAASAMPLAIALVVAWRGRAHLWVLASALVISAVLAGFLAATLRTIRVSAPILQAPVSATVVGHVESIERTAYGGRIVLSVQTYEPPIEAGPERIRLTFRGGNAVVAGDRVQVRARLGPPTPPSVPAGFDFQREAYFQRLGAVGTVTGQVSMLPDSGPMPIRFRILAAIDAARNAMTERIISVIGGSTGAIAAALVTGKRGQISETDNESWRGAGIYHIISISGLHMALAAGLFFWTARFILTVLPILPKTRSPKKISALIAMAGTVAYDIFSGHDVATERSMIMTLVMLGAILVDRPALAMRNLAISGLIVMTLRPETVLGPSFQMSFGAVAGLVAYGEFLRRRRESSAVKHAGRDDRLTVRALRIGADFAATSLIAGLATAPFQAFHFHRLNSYGLLGNALAVPLCSAIVMPAALAGVILYPFGLDAPAWLLMGLGISTISSFAEQVAGLSGAVATVPRFSTPALAGMAVAIAFLTLMTTGIFRAVAVTVGLISVALAGRAPRPEVIVSHDGRHALVRGTDGMVLLGKGRPAFALQQWLPGEGDARAPRDPALTKAARCDSLGCTYARPGGSSIALVLERSAFAEDCERASVLITPMRAPQSCTGRAQIYDRNYLDRYGATYLYADRNGTGTFYAETTRNPRQERPWLPRKSAVLERIEINSGQVKSQPAISRAPAWEHQAPDGQAPDTMEDNQ